MSSFFTVIKDPFYCSFLGMHSNLKKHLLWDNINFPYWGPQDLFTTYVWLSVFLHCFILNLGIVRMIYSFHLNTLVGLFAQPNLCPEPHTMLQMYRRLCCYMLVSFLQSVLKRQLLLWQSVNMMDFPIRFARWLSLTRTA